MPWAELTEELDRWSAEARQATLWWRDDGAADWTPNLFRLIELAGAADVPLALAVPPDRAAPRLAERLDGTPGLRVLQFGAGTADPKGVMAAAFAGSLCWDWIRLLELFGALALPVLVPTAPRVPPAVTEGFAALGYRGLSMQGPRRHDHAGLGLTWVNVHVPVIDARRAGTFAGERRVLDSLIGQLRARRLGGVDPVEPTGLLTRHGEHDDASWTFLQRLFALTRGHPAATWLTPEAVFLPPSAPAKADPSADIARL